jgi:hypothetical protein
VAAPARTLIRMREQLRGALARRLAWMRVPGAWTPQTACYLAYRSADYVVMNLGEDAALVALAFC